MENNKNKKSVKFQGDMLNFCDFIQVFVFTRNHHLNTAYSFTLKLKWLGKGLLSLTKIRSYIKNRCILGIQAKDIFNEICHVYGNNDLSFFICNTVVSEI